MACCGAARERLGERVWVSASCSLLHVPSTWRQETRLDRRNQRLARVRAHRSSTKSRHSSAGSLPGTRPLPRELASSRGAAASRRESTRTRSEFVRRGWRDHGARRPARFPVRRPASRRQRERLKLPLLPTTTIGSFPQTPEIRRARAAFKRGETAFSTTSGACARKSAWRLSRQEALGLDVLVHGGRPSAATWWSTSASSSRDTLVTANGWVQSYGSRCVKPPIIYGDVLRAEPMTVDWNPLRPEPHPPPGQGHVDRPRDDAAVVDSCATTSRGRRRRCRSRSRLRDEVLDLEKAGIASIQIGRARVMEGLPLRRRDWPRYLDWAVRAFKLASCSVADATQIHTHMCYAEFNDILPAIAALDADVITIETSRSEMELLDGFGEFSYPNEIGPGLYDIHSPRVPAAESMLRLIDRAAQVIPLERLWVNPDCGLKTRGWEETEAALAGMVEAARQRRALAHESERIPRQTQSPCPARSSVESRSGSAP
jgi:5-methyltetrahydropteroyltriglutamate--homocysteine methyltransferase